MKTRLKPYLIAGALVASAVAGGWFQEIRHENGRAETEEETVISTFEPQPDLDRLPANSPPPPTGNKSPQKWERLAALRSCYDSHQCDYPQTEPRGYTVAVALDLLRELRTQLDQHRNDPVALSELAAEARELIRIQDGVLQKGALEVLATQPPSGENIQAITEGLTQTPDPSLMSDAMEVMKNYIGTSWEGQVHQFLSGSMRTGGHFSGETAAENILPFLNPSSVDQYRQTLTQMSPGSSAYRKLRALIDEYDRLQTGG